MVNGTLLTEDVSNTSLKEQWLFTQTEIMLGTLTFTESALMKYRMEGDFAAELKIQQIQLRHYVSGLVICVFTNSNSIC